jgi:hypothetical protein
LDEDLSSDPALGQSRPEVDVIAGRLPNEAQIPDLASGIPHLESSLAIRLDVSERAPPMFWTSE